MNLPLHFFNLNRLLKKSRCILPLPNLFPSLARRFPFPHPLGLGFDSAAPRAPEKSKVGES